MSSPADPGDLRVPPAHGTAVVHEWVAARAGSEQVFERLAALFPDADLYALSVDPRVRFETAGRPITTTRLDHPALRDRRGVTLPLMPLAWRRLSTGRAHDLVVTSHHAFATSNRLTRPGGLHLAYVHSPARYVWTPEIDGRGSGAHLQAARTVLRRVDRAAVRRVDGIAANSSTVAARIRRFWDRDAVVVHPPVRTQFFGGGARGDQPRGHALAFGRWIPYKRMDLAIRAAARAGVPLVVAGSGPEEARLRELAGSLRHDVTFVHRPTDDELCELYRSAVALIFPTVEDFGIVPVEAQAGGAPVIAPREGGATDTVVDGRTGILLDEVDEATVADALDRVTRRGWDDFTEHVERFSPEAFDRAVGRWVVDAGADPSRLAPGLDLDRLR